MNQAERKLAKRAFFDRVEYEVLCLLGNTKKTLGTIIKEVRTIHPHDDADIVAVMGLMRLQHKGRAVLKREADGQMCWSRIT